MDTELLVEERIEDGQSLIDRLARDGFPVAVAFWVKTRLPVLTSGLASGTVSYTTFPPSPQEEGQWFLYIGSPSVNPESPGAAYGTVYAALSRVPDPCFSLLEIKLVNSTNPAVRDALAVRKRYPGRILDVNSEKRFGDLSVDKMYIYPARGKGTPELEELWGLLEKESPLGLTVVAAAYFEEKLGALLSQPKKSFGDLIDAAFADGLLTPNERDDLREILKLRNEFAHDLRAASFGVEKEQGINSLKTWKIASAKVPAYNDLFPTAKERLLYVVGILAVRLRRRSAKTGSPLPEPDFLDITAWPPVTSF